MPKPTTPASDPKAAVQAPANYRLRTVACPTCGAEVGKTCVATNTGRAINSHAARIAAGSGVTAPADRKAAKPAKAAAKKAPAKPRKATAAKAAPAPVVEVDVAVQREAYAYGIDCPVCEAAIDSPCDHVGERITARLEAEDDEARIMGHGIDAAKSVDGHVFCLCNERVTDAAALDLHIAEAAVRASEAAAATPEAKAEAQRLARLAADAAPSAADLADEDGVDAEAVAR